MPNSFPWLKRPDPLFSKRHAYWMAGIIGVLLVYAIALIFPIPAEIGLTMRYSPFVPLVAIPLLLYPLYRRPEPLAFCLSFCVTLILFALPLSGLWNSGISEFPTLAGGLLPLADGVNYYQDARRILEGGRFGEISSGRPLFIAMFGALLGLTHQNLQLTLVILAAIAAASCFLLSREIQRTHGTVAGITVLTVLYFFYRRFAGVPWTENLGLGLGALAFALLWRGVDQRRSRPFLFGILLLALALNARAGAFLVLPALVFWGSWFFRGESRISLRFLGWGFGALFLSFLLNYLMLLVVGSPDVAFSNYAYVFYANVVGARSWQQVRLDYPEVLELSGADLSSRIYELAFERLRENPLILVRTSLEAIALFLSPTSQGSFSFVTDLSGAQSSRFTIYLFYLLSGVGLFRCLRQRRNRHSLLVLAISLGVIVSLPMVPPWVGSAGRIYAATVPISAILPALGLSFLGQRAKWNVSPKVSPKVADYSLRAKALPIFSILLVGFSILGPALTKAVDAAILPPQISQMSLPVQQVCPNSERVVFVRYVPGSVVHLVSDESIRQTHLPNVRISDFLNGLQSSGATQRREVQPLTALTSGTTVMSALDLNPRSLKNVWIFAESASLPKRGVLQVCGRREGNAMYADSVQSVAP
jgi:hypothetical protein